MRGAFYGYPAHLVWNLRKSKGKLSHLMAQIDLAQALSKLRPGLVSLVSETAEEEISTLGGSNVIALAAAQLTLIGLHVGELFAFAMKLLNRPAHAVFLLGS